MLDSGGAAAAPAEFPAGLRVLLVDDDPTCLKILDRMLRKCLYNGTFFRPRVGKIAFLGLGARLIR